MAHINNQERSRRIVVAEDRYRHMTSTNRHKVDLAFARLMFNRRNWSQDTCFIRAVKIVHGGEDE